MKIQFNLTENEYKVFKQKAQERIVESPNLIGREQWTLDDTLTGTKIVKALGNFFNDEKRNSLNEHLRQGAKVMADGDGIPDKFRKAFSKKTMGDENEKIPDGAVDIEFLDLLYIFVTDNTEMTFFKFFDIQSSSQLVPFVYHKHLKKFHNLKELKRLYSLHTKMPSTVHNDIKTIQVKSFDKIPEKKVKDHDEWFRVYCETLGKLAALNDPEVVKRFIAMGEKIMERKEKSGIGYFYYTIPIIVGLFLFIPFFSYHLSYKSSKNILSGLGVNKVLSKTIGIYFGIVGLVGSVLMSLYFFGVFNSSYVIDVDETKRKIQVKDTIDPLPKKRFSTDSTKPIKELPIFDNIKLADTKDCDFVGGKGSYRINREHFRGMAIHAGTASNPKTGIEGTEEFYFPVFIDQYSSLSFFQHFYLHPLSLPHDDFLERLKQDTLSSSISPLTGKESNEKFEHLSPWVKNIESNEMKLFKVDNFINSVGFLDFGALNNGDAMLLATLKDGNTIVVSEKGFYIDFTTLKICKGSYIMFIPLFVDYQLKYIPISITVF